MPTRLIQLMENLPPARIVLVGDFMLDRYVFGSTSRISPEAPIPVLKYHHEECRLGGAGFVLAALATLGAQVIPVGVASQDIAGHELRRLMQTIGADISGMIAVPGRPTITKTRFLGSSEDRSPHQMIRLDIEDADSIDSAMEQKLIATATAALDGAAALCLEDYNKGVLTPTVCRALIAAARHRQVPVFIDAARLTDCAKYRGATMVKPNRPEAERATGLPARTPDQYRAVAEKLLEMLDLEAAVLTLNDAGSYVATRAGQRELLRSRPREVADSTGAGDMVLAMLTMARAAGAGWSDAVALANVAGGLEVQHLGCVAVTKAEIIHDLLIEHHQHAGKRRTLDQLLPELQCHRAAGKRIVFTNGCFDLIHLGHIKYFQFAKQQGDLLVVGVNTDASIQRLKGNKRPIIAQADRISVLEELESIDYLIAFDDDTPLGLIAAIQPDVLVKGADYTKQQVVGWDIVEASGGRVALAPLIDGRSTSTVIQRVLAAYGGGGEKEGNVQFSTLNTEEGNAQRSTLNAQRSTQETRDLPLR